MTLDIEWADHDPGVSVYQSRSYGNANAKAAGEDWQVLSDRNARWRIPMCIRSVGDGRHVDAASPYGYPGIFADPKLTAAEIESGWSQSIDALRERGVVSLFLRFAPYRRGPETRFDLPGLEVRNLSETVLVTLSDEMHMWEGMQGRSRTAIRKAEREGLRAMVLKSGKELPLCAGSGFRRVYEAAMARVGASPFHLYDDDYYRALNEAPDVSMRLIEVTNRHNEVVAASLLLLDEEAVHYHLSGSFAEAAKAGANNLMLWTAMRWAAAEGHDAFHLGGGTSRGDGLFKFKASFGGTSHPYNVGRLIVDPDAYSQLEDTRAASLGVSPKVLHTSSFFPSYRTAAT